MTARTLLPLAAAVLAVAALLALRGARVPASGWHETQWAAGPGGTAEGAPLREGVASRPRIEHPTDPVLARPGDVVVEWRGFLRLGEAGALGVVLESGGAAVVEAGGREVARTGGSGRARGSVALPAGPTELRVLVHVPAGGGRFRAVVQAAGAAPAPLEALPVTLAPVTGGGEARARRTRRVLDPALALAALVLAAGLARAIAGDDRGRRAAEVAASATVLAVALLGEHGVGGAFWGTATWAGVPPLARAGLLALGLVPWALAIARIPAPLSRGLPDGRAGPGLAAAAAFALGWLLREERLGGDAWITLAILEGRDPAGPFGPFFWKEPLDRLVAVATSRALAPLGVSVRDAIALTSCVAGAGAAFALARARDGRAAALVATAGAALVFFGHVENYAWVSAALVAFGLAAARAAGGTGSPFAAGALGGLAVAFHPVGAFAVVPALAGLALARREHPGEVLRAAAGALLPPLALALGALAAGIAPPAIGPNRFADDPSVLLAPAEALGASRWPVLASRAAMLLSPGIVLAALAGLARPRRPARATWPLIGGTAGALAHLVFLHGKIRPEIEDWDLYAPAAFPIALLAARALPRAPSTVAWCAGVSGAVLLAGALGRR